MWQKPLRDFPGWVVTKWRRGGETATFAGFKGSVVSFGQTITKKSRSAWASVGSPPNQGGPHGFVTASMAARRMYAEVIAIGHSRAFASRMVQDTFGKKSLHQKTPSYADSSYFNSPCSNVSQDGGQTWGLYCLVQRMAQNTEPNSVYVVDSNTVSGNSTAFLFPLCQLEGLDQYQNVNDHGPRGIVSWNPSSSVPVGQPTTKTYTAAYNGFSVGVSETVFPASLNPVLTACQGSYATSFGAEWKGDNTGQQTMGAPSTDMAHIWTPAPSQLSRTCT